MSNQKATIALLSLLGAGGVIFAFAVPKVSRDYKPSGTRMTPQFNVLTDRQTGDIYGWMEGKNGEQRFVKMDKIAESSVRRERDKVEKAEDAPEPIVYDKQDVRSGQIFCRDTNFNEFNVDTCIKYRLRERKMLYRLTATMEPRFKTDNQGKSIQNKCLTKNQEAKLKSLKKIEKNNISFRFVDEDNFWLKDSVIPLTERFANNYNTTVIDSSEKDECGFVTKLIFHGRMANFTLPDYTWVDDGKLIFEGVRWDEKVEEVDKVKLK